MFYPKANCCPFNTDEEKMPLTNQQATMRATNENDSKPECKPENSEPSKDSMHDMMRRIQEIDFAVIDLNLFLDTHPNCREALELFTKLAATSKSLKNDFQRKYGPLCAKDSPNTVPFVWVSDDNKWPWQKQEVK